LSGSSCSTPPFGDPIEEQCDKITSETTLSSPVPPVLAKIRKNDLLDIQVDHSGKTPVVRAVFHGETAGSITSSVIQRIVECIEKGHVYVAEVLSITGGACKVRVRIK
jgi:hypothetical protein